jgi:hypothetical protein
VEDEADEIPSTKNHPKAQDAVFDKELEGDVLRSLHWVLGWVRGTEGFGWFKAAFFSTGRLGKILGSSRTADGMKALEAKSLSSSRTSL